MMPVRSLTSRRSHWWHAVEALHGIAMAEGVLSVADIPLVSQQTAWRVCQAAQLWGAIVAAAGKHRLHDGSGRGLLADCRFVSLKGASQVLGWVTKRRKGSCQFSAREGTAQVLSAPGDGGYQGGLASLSA